MCSSDIRSCVQVALEAQPLEATEAGDGGGQLDEHVAYSRANVDYIHM